MRDIFTYPSNSSTYWIDPRYYGDDTVGFRGRLKQVYDGTVGGSYNWAVTAPTQSLDALTEWSGRYAEYYMQKFGDDNITMYDWTLRPLTEFRCRPWQSFAIESVQSVIGPGASLAADFHINVTGHGFVSGDPYLQYNLVVESEVGHTLVAQTNPYTVAGPNTTTNTIDAGATVVILSDDHETRFIRNGDATKVFTDNSEGFGKFADSMWGSTWLSSNNRMSVFKTDSFDESHDTGTANVQTRLYAEFVQGGGGDYHSATLYTDAACTTGATLTENLYDTATITVNMTQGTEFDINNYSVATHISSAAKTAMAADGDGWCRVYYQSLSGGTWVGAFDSTKTIGASRDYAQDFYWTYDSINEQVDVFDTRSLEGASQYADFGYTGGGATETVQIVIEFINPARMTDSSPDSHFALHFDSTLDTTTNTFENNWIVPNSSYNTSESAPYGEIHDLTFYAYGNTAYTYRNSGGSYVAGYAWNDRVFEPGEDSQTLSTWDMLETNFDVTLPQNSNGYFTADPITYTNRGKFGRADLRFFVDVVQQADEYVPPAATDLELAAAEDNFDTNSEWDDYSGFSQAKVWPLIPPKSARIDMRTPNINTYSQSGQKFTRHAGFTRWTLDVQYPPLKPDQMQQMLAYSELARGGAVKFYFDLDPLNTNSTFGFIRHTTMSNYVPRVKSFSNQILTLEGFAGNESNVIEEGMLMNSGGLHRNGAVELALNNADANIYGEVKVKLGFNDYDFTPVVGGQAWLTIDRLIVTLLEDNFQYVDRGDGLYDVSVQFELGYWT